MANIFITGHTGFVAGHLIPKLIELGHSIETDMRYLHTRKFDTVVHLGAKTHIRCDFDPELINSNITLTEEIFKVPTKILYASSCSAQFLNNPYAYTKRYAEHLGSVHGKAIGLRFFNIFGPGNNKGIVWYLMQQPNGSKITIRGKDLVRDYIFIDDIVKCIIFLLRPLGLYIDLRTIRELQKQNQYAKMSVEEIIKHVHGLPLQVGENTVEHTFTGVTDVGTGIGTTTIDLVNLYMRLSGKKFELIFEEAGSNEPASMIADNSTFGLTKLEDGLKKTIAASKNNSVNYDHIKQNR